MEKAWKVLVILFFVNLVIYVTGGFVYENFLVKFLEPASKKLSPYGVEILHLR
ncbi:MAG: hypothetical protein AAB371_01370 [Patescibacteria group bacterium]